jgi:hypothetical protein
MDARLNIPTKTDGKGAKKPRLRRPSLRPGPGQVRPEARLLTRENLDGRTKACQRFAAVAHAIAEDLGGEAYLSTIQKHLVEAFAGVSIHLADLHARLLLGEKVNIMDHSTAVSTMVRIAQRVGVRRVARDITPDPLDYARETRDDEDVGDEDAT